MAETFLTGPGIVLAGFRGDAMFVPITDSAKMKAAFAKASKAEREQIIAFVRANTEPPRLAFLLKAFPATSWKLGWLGTDRKRLTVAYQLDKSPGISFNDMRRIVGLNPLIIRGKRA